MLLSFIDGTDRVGRFENVPHVIPPSYFLQLFSPVFFSSSPLYSGERGRGVRGKESSRDNQSHPAFRSHFLHNGLGAHHCNFDTPVVGRQASMAMYSFFAPVITSPFTHPIRKDKHRGSEDTEISLQAYNIQLRALCASVFPVRITDLNLNEGSIPHH